MKKVRWPVNYKFRKHLGKRYVQCPFCEKYAQTSPLGTIMDHPGQPKYAPVCAGSGLIVTLAEESHADPSRPK